MKVLVRKKWRWLMCICIALIAVGAIVLGPPLVQFIGGLFGALAILAIIISGNDGGEGSIPPWYGGGGSGGGL